MSDARKIQEVLGRVKVRFLEFTFLAVLLGLAAIVGAALAAEVALDELLTLPVGIRLLILLALGSFSCWVLYRRLARPILLGVSDLYLARAIERHYAGLKNGPSTS